MFVVLGVLLVNGAAVVFTTCAVSSSKGIRTIKTTDDN